MPRRKLLLTPPAIHCELVRIASMDLSKLSGRDAAAADRSAGVVTVNAGLLILAVQVARRPESCKWPPVSRGEKMGGEVVGPKRYSFGCLATAMQSIS